MPVDIAVAAEAAQKVSEIVGLVGKLKTQLTKQPKPAARELAVALDQVYATFQAVASEVAAFLALGASIDALKERAPSLPQLQGALLRTRIRNARGHCSLIWPIYTTHLEAWFNGALSEVDRLAAKAAFQMLGEADASLFGQMAEIATSLSSEAAAVEDLTLEGKWDEARARVLDSRKRLRALEQVLGTTMDELSDLKVAFIELSGVSKL